MSTFEEYSSVIFWDFKRRDNVDYNFKIIEVLSNCASESSGSEYFYKPIFLILASVVECTLYDFLMKIQEHRYEEVPNMDSKDIEDIQNMDIPNKLGNFKEICKKYKLFKTHVELYESIEDVANIRNRIHIQNQKDHKPKDEKHLWTKEQVKTCGNLLKEIYILMCEKYPRPQKFHLNTSMSNFPEPWTSL